MGSRRQELVNGYRLPPKSMGFAGTQSGFHWGHISCNIHKNATGLLNSYQYIGTQSGLQAPKTNKRLKASSQINGFRWNPKWVPLGTQQLQYPQKCNRWDLDFGTGPHVEGGIPSAQFLLSTACSARSVHKVLEHAVSLIFPTLQDGFTKVVCQHLTYTV